MIDPRTAPTRKMPVVTTPKVDPRLAPTKLLPSVKKASFIKKMLGFK